MTSNLLDLIKRGLPADFSDLASKAVGESPGATQTALTAALPALGTRLEADAAAHALTAFC